MQVYINREGQQYGPFTKEQVDEALAQGSLLSSDLAWHEGAPQWVPLSQLTATLSLSSSVPSTSAAKPVSPKKEGQEDIKTIPATGGKKWYLWAGIGVGIVAVLALVWVFFLKNGTSATSEEPIRPPTAEEKQKSAEKIEAAIRKTIKKPKGVLAPRDLKKVTELELWGLSIYDLAALSGLEKLKKLDLVGNHINDLTPLANLKNLEDLALDRNQVTDLSALSGLSKLKTLGLEANRITDLTPLAQLKQLKSLQLKDNPRLTKAQVQTLQQALPGCKIDSNAEQ